MRTFALVSVASLLAATSAQASILGTTGSATFLSTPPTSCTPGSLTGFTLYCWDEAVAAPTGGVPMQMSVNPSTVLNNTGMTPGPAPAIVNSHFLHFDGPVPAVLLGTITFNAPILGVIYNDNPLDFTDASLGASGTAYPTSLPQRGWNGFRSVSINVNTLQFELQPGFNGIGGQIEQLRVLTAVPAPGTVALAGMGAICWVRRARRR